MPNQSVHLFTASSRAVLQNDQNCIQLLLLFLLSASWGRCSYTTSFTVCLLVHPSLRGPLRASEWEQVHSTDLLFQDYIRIGFMFGLRSVGKTLSDGPRTDRRVCARVCSLPLSCPVESDVELLSDLTVSSGNTHTQKQSKNKSRKTLVSSSSWNNGFSSTASCECLHMYACVSMSHLSHWLRLLRL